MLRELSGVEGFSVGDQVFAIASTFAELCDVNAASLAKIPK